MVIAPTGQFRTHAPHMVQFSYTAEAITLSGGIGAVVTTLPNLPATPFGVINPLESPNEPSPQT